VISYVDWSKLWKGSPAASPPCPFPHPPKRPSQTDGRSEFIYKIRTSGPLVVVLLLLEDIKGYKFVEDLFKALLEET
jgi:hypothetical protein